MSNQKSFKLYYEDQQTEMLSRSLLSDISIRSITMTLADKKFVSSDIHTINDFNVGTCCRSNTSINDCHFGLHHTSTL